MFLTSFNAAVIWSIVAFGMLPFLLLLSLFESK